MKTLKKIREATIKLSPVGHKTFVHAPTGSSAKIIGSEGHGGGAYVTGVHTPVEHRGKGGAHEVMRQVTQYLDDRGKTGSLKARGLESHVDQKKLKKFYEKHGFKSVDHEGNMTREPKR